MVVRRDTFSRALIVADPEALGGEVLGRPGALALDTRSRCARRRGCRPGTTVSFSPSAPLRRRRRPWLLGGERRPDRVCLRLVGDDRGAVAAGQPGEGDEGDVLRSEPGHAGCQGDQAVGVGQGLVGGERLGRLVEDPPDPQRVGQQPGVGDLLDQRRQEDLLPVDPADVRPVADVVSDPDEGQGVLAGHAGPARGQVHAGLVVLQRPGQADLDATQGVDRLLEAVEVQNDEVVDRQAASGLRRPSRCTRDRPGRTRR